MQQNIPRWVFEVYIYIYIYILYTHIYYIHIHTRARTRTHTHICVCVCAYTQNKLQVIVHIIHTCNTIKTNLLSQLVPNLLNYILLNYEKTRDYAMCKFHEMQCKNTMSKMIYIYYYIYTYITRSKDILNTLQILKYREQYQHNVSIRKSYKIKSMI